MRVAHSAQPFRENYFLWILSVGYAALWSALAIAPAYRPQWLLENYLVFAFVAALVLAYKRFPLSNFSYALLAIFLTLHAVGAHYGYSSVPWGFWLHDLLKCARANPFDRVVHFFFGFLFAYPLHEVLTRYTSVRSGWRYVLPIEFILSYSAAYEIIEAATAWTLPEAVYDPFVGLQGDIWDGYRDMLLAATGALSAMVLTFFVKRSRGVAPS